MKRILLAALAILAPATVYVATHEAPAEVAMCCAEDPPPGCPGPGCITDQRLSPERQ